MSGEKRCVCSINLTGEEGGPDEQESRRGFERKLRYCVPSFRHTTQSLKKVDTDVFCTWSSICGQPRLFKRGVSKFVFQKEGVWGLAFWTSRKKNNSTERGILFPKRPRHEPHEAKNVSSAHCFPNLSISHVLCPATNPFSSSHLSSKRSDRREGRGAKSVFLPFCVPHPLNTPPPLPRNQFKAPYRQIGFLFALECEAPLRVLYHAPGRSSLVA